jgi:glycosyltransferase involved in cell wall biosynthesis
LYNRNIKDTVEGFFRFFKEYENLIEMNYTIIASGTVKERNSIVSKINDLGMNGHISFKGSIRSFELDEFYKISNVGVSYIPVTDYFDHQPPLKTYEYLMNGLPVIATGTEQNKLLINTGNGVIIEDSSDGFYMGLNLIFNNRLSYKSENIQAESLEYSWETIIKENVIPIIETCILTENSIK